MARQLRRCAAALALVAALAGCRDDDGEAINPRAPGPAPAPAEAPPTETVTPVPAETPTPTAGPTPPEPPQAG